MDWIKQNIDRVALALLGAALLGCSGWIIFSTLSFPNLFSERNSPKKPDHTVQAPPTAAITAAAVMAAQPKTWGAHDGSLLVSRPYVLKKVGNELVLIDPLESTIHLHDPIKNSWLDKYSLDYANPNIKDEDPDTDKFTNLEEFLNNTDPTDSKSIPGYYTKLRLEKFDPKPFRLKFGGDSGDGETFIINTRDAGGRTQFLKLGQTIEGAPYKLLSYQKKRPTREDIEVNEDELTIENTDTGKKIVLVYDKEANDPTSFGVFRYLYDNSTMRIKIDDSFTLVPEDNRKYKLIDISESKAIIQDLEKGEKYDIPPIEK